MSCSKKIKIVKFVRFISIIMNGNNYVLQFMSKIPLVFYYKKKKNKQTKTKNFPNKIRTVFVT